MSAFSDDKMNATLPFYVKHYFPTGFICVIYRLEFSAPWVKRLT